MCVMIYVPDDLTEADDAMAYFHDTLVEVAEKVRDRLTRRRPGMANRRACRRCVVPATVIVSRPK